MALHPANQLFLVTEGSMLQLTSATFSVLKADASAHHVPLAESFHKNTMHMEAALSQLEITATFDPTKLPSQKETADLSGRSILAACHARKHVHCACYEA
jgi:hypothetical protein